MTRKPRRVVCITGAGRGLGAALAERFGTGGFDVVLGARTAPEIDALAESLADRGVGTLAVQTDVRLAVECERLVDAALAEFGRLDVMINNAGVAVYGPASDMTASDVDLMLDTNLKGTIFGSLAAFRAMKAQAPDPVRGRIINISSIAGKRMLPGESVYCATKWGVNGFTGTLAIEAAQSGIHVTAVCPGGINTPFWRTMDTFPFPDHIQPERDFMDPAEVAESIWQIANTSAQYTVPEVVMQPLIPEPGNRG